MQPIICPKCHSEVEYGSGKCPKCGADLSEAQSKGVTLSNSYINTPNGEKPNQVNQQHVAQAIMNDGKKKENPKAALAIGVVFILAVIILIAVLFFSGTGGNNANPSQDASSTPTASVVSTASSETTVSSVESSATESSSADIEESSATAVAESSEESSATESADTNVITVEKPDDWNDIYCYVYTKSEIIKGNGAFPGVKLTESDGNKYTYTIPEDVMNESDIRVIFSTKSLADGSKRAKQYPYSGKDGFEVSSKKDFTVDDFNNYAEENKNSQ